MCNDGSGDSEYAVMELAQLEFTIGQHQMRSFSYYVLFFIAVFALKR